MFSDNWISFELTETNSGESEKNCLDYGKAIIEGQYQCIEKPENSYYVISGDDNTGVIKLCYIACSTCNSGKKL